MAQVVKLKRTSVQGRIPTISNLELGELAINTHDGRIFFEKDDGTLSIQEILTTNSQNSGSFNLQGAISASSLSISGDTTIGGNLVLAGNITIGDASSDTIAFAGELSSDIIPATTNTYDLGSSTFAFSEIHSTNLYGAINATNGVVSGSSQLTSSFDTRYLNVSGEGNISGSFSGSFTGDGSGLTNLVVGENVISGSSQVNADEITNFDSNVKDKMNLDNVISGSSQITITQSQISDVTATATEINKLDGVTSNIQTQLNSKQGTITTGIADNNIVEIDDTDVSINDYAKFTTNGLQGRSYSEVKTDLALNNVTNESKATMFDSPTFTGTVSGVSKSHVGLGNVENTSLSTYTGQNGALDNQYITNGAGYITSFTDTQLSNEQVQDIVGGMVSSNTESGITVTYQDTDGTLDFSVASQTDNNFTNTLKTKLDGIAENAEVNVVDSVAGKTGAVTLVKGDVGLGNVDNTSDADKPISTATQTALNGKVGTTSAQALGTAANVLTLSGNTLTLARGDNSTDTIDLSAYLDEDSRSISSGTLNSVSGVVTFTRDDSTTFTLDLSDLLDDTNLVTSVAGRNGVVVLTNSDVGLGNVENTALSTYTGNGGALDNQYITNGAGYITSFTDTQLSNEQVQDIVGGMVTGNTESGITVTYQDDDGTIDFSVASQTDNNFTNTLKTKLDGIAASANNYVHPNYAGDDISIDTGALTGATVISDLDFNITTDTNGHVSDANGTFSTRTLTLSDLGYSGATNANYITNNNQLTNGAGYITSFDITTQTDSKYLRSDTSDTMNGALEIYSSGSTVLDIQGSQGQLFSVTDDLTGTLFTVSDISGIPIFEVDASGESSFDGDVTIDGELNVTGDVIAYASSDERLKENITPIENATDKVKQIGGYTFDWKSDIENITSRSGNDIGLIAQEVEKVVPQVVTTRTNGYKGVDYQKLVALLIESNKELASRIEELEKKIQ